ncbi:SigE family RNA polymerase sigma factor [Nocardioides guangzhouensis]|uniref:SigE family RNA polymerase sigma factor n=1 Tax=Nocardioides guangzhouensis TaxID=2497878 RepID=A0A4Q4Z3M9_9ACTN|nr:SigE family RNA polymerase sigma factor [Nocardioides guangzhouensis]RYP82263.1 SigE family RNA polymerase sigma factor [Nocardioides guangzhouensis]
MGTEQEFTEYVGTRWPRMVRTAVLLGCTRAEAEEVVGTALAGCLARWSQVRRAEDREAHVHRALVEAFLAVRRERWPGEFPLEHPLDTGPSLIEGDDVAERELADAVLRGLARLPEHQRIAVVLCHYAGLDELQAATAAGVSLPALEDDLVIGVEALAGDPALAGLGGGA